MNCFKEFVQKLVEIAFVEVADSCGVLYVCLCLFQCTVNGLAVIECFGKLDDFWSDEDVASGNFSF